MPVRTDKSAPQQAPPSIAGAVRGFWALDPPIAFLNHGSFGATPVPVLEAQHRLRLGIEARPIEMLARRCREQLDGARAVVGPFVGASPSDLAFVTNATGAINAVLHSLSLRPGDELLTTNHAYNAVLQGMRYHARRAGATLVQAQIPLPVRRPQDVLVAVEQALTSRTRLLIVDHVTSPTALIFPVKAIIDLCRARGVDVLVDGAHAPGSIDLDISSLSPAYYTANLHKWVCAPKGSAFLWIRPDRQSTVHPLTISHHLDTGMQAEFDWQGTRDITPWVCAADAIRFMGRLLPGGWPEVMSRNHALAVWVQSMLCERWGVEPCSPMDGSMLAAMATVPLPDAARRFEQADRLQARLYDRHHIEVPVVDWNGRWYVRPCCQLYNAPRDYERLADAVRIEIG